MYKRQVIKLSGKESISAQTAPGNINKRKSSNRITYNNFLISLIYWLILEAQDVYKRQGIGGYVRATAEYDFGGIVKDVDFYPAPVSYTHLDVYKRQVYTTLGIVAKRIERDAARRFGFILSADHLNSLCLLYTSRCV